VMCLDVLRTLKRPQEAALFATLARAFDIDTAKFQIANEATARDLVGTLALVASATALRETAPPAIADAFMQSRLTTRHAMPYGAATFDTPTTEMLLRRVLAEA
jgi:hypothetical protein